VVPAHCARGGRRMSREREAKNRALTGRLSSHADPFGSVVRVASVQ